MRARVDDNQEEIVAAYRKIGCSVVSMAAQGDGFPDLVVGYRQRNFLIEIKDGNKKPSKRLLTPDQVIFHATWCGQVSIVENVQEALEVVTK